MNGVKGRAVEVINERGLWAARLQSMPGCVAQAASREEALAALKAVVPSYIKAREERGAPVAPLDLPAGTSAIIECWSSSESER